MTEVREGVQSIASSEQEDSKQVSELTKELNIGLIIPIAEIAGLNEHHWEDVRRIINEALNDVYGYKTKIKLVSDSDEVRVIQSNIVQNIYSNEIVIIDVSAKNPNVMFEFGMRLAFDMPFVVIKDDETPFIFDTGNIQHLEYPRDLRYTKIEEFKRKLKHKVLSTLKYKEGNPNKSLYLSEYGNLIPKKIDTIETDIATYLGEVVKGLQSSIRKAETVERKVNVNDLRGEIYEILYEYDNRIERLDWDSDFFKLLEYVTYNIGHEGETLSSYGLQYHVREVYEKYLNKKSMDSLPF